MSAHTEHPDVIKRLKRAAGHLQSIIVMLEEDRHCLDIAQQLQAVDAAAVKRVLNEHVLQARHVTLEYTQAAS